MNVQIGPLESSMWNRATFSTGHVAVRAGIKKAAKGLLAVLTEALARGTDPLNAVKDLRGSFAIVAKVDNTLIAAVDFVRSIPLFYAMSDGVLYINDDPRWITTQVPAAGINSAALSEFALTGFVTGDETLFTGISQLQAGETLCFREGVDVTPRITQCHGWDPGIASASSGGATRENELMELLEHSVDAITSRLISHADGQQLVVPLSGGYDSRLIAASLISHGYDNIVTFAYGLPDSTESAISRAIAEKLGLSWIKVDYGTHKWRDWHQSSERQQYFRDAHLGTSLPHIQDWPAVWCLRERHAVEEDAIFVPGHTGDFVAGGHILPQFDSPGKSDITQLVAAIQHRHYGFWPSEYAYSDDLSLQARIGSRLGNLPTVMDNRNALDAAESFNYRERQSKFIAHSVRSYEFWEYEWWLPLWDLEFLRFWTGVPLEFRRGTRFYIEYVARKYSRLAGLPLAEGYRRDSADGRLSNLAATFRRLLPPDARRFLSRALRRKERYAVSHPLGYFGWLDDAFVRAHPQAGSVNSFLMITLLDETGLRGSLNGRRELPRLRLAE